MYTYIYLMCSMLVHTNEHRMPNILAAPVQLAPWAPTASGWSNASAATCHGDVESWYLLVI